MEDLSQMVQGVLSNPELMQQIMGMAQALGGPPQKEGDAPKKDPDPEPMPGPDLSGLGELTKLLNRGNIDSHQQALLTALGPYLSDSHIGKLRRAMQAAAMADLAAGVLGTRGLGGGSV